MSSGHLVSQIQHPELSTDNTLHVVGVLTNVVRWHSRYRLARQWIAEMEKTPNVKCYVVEAAYKDRKFEVTCPNNPQHLQVHTQSEIWLKENLINLGVKHLLPANWKYMAWVDMDVHFRDPNWALNTIHQLQHYNILQPWSHAADLDFHGGHLNTFESFGSLIDKGKEVASGKGTPYTYGHTGFAWACTRYWYENVEKLLDFSILGAGDHTMAWGTIGNVDKAIHPKIGEGYRSLCEQWSKKSERAASGIVGYVHGRIEHHFHGHKADRKYWSRWDILIDNKFNPITDVAYDSQGVLVLCGANKYKLEHDIMRYNRERSEDAV